jgi:hypothetical protein
VTQTPLFAVPLYGLRFWRVTVDDGGEWLSAPYQDAPWPTGGEWLQATCALGHEAPAHGCDCGVHAWHPRRRTAGEVLAVRGVVPGIMEAEGAIEVHEDGLRAARARPHALIATPGCNRARVDRLAERYGIPVLELSGPAAVVAWCREHDIGMGEDVVAELLGTGDPAERRRARFRKQRNNALRVAAAFALVALLVVLALAVSNDPPGPRTLHGRTGEIHIH